MNTKLIESKLSSIIDDFFMNFFKMHFKKLYPLVEQQYEDQINEYTIFLNDIKKTMFIAGGSITNMILNKKVKDYDIFIDDEKIRSFIIDYCILYVNEMINDFEGFKWSNKFHCFYSLKDSMKDENKKIFDDFENLHEANKFYNISFYHECCLNNASPFDGISKIILSKNAITIKYGESIFQFIICKSFNRNELCNSFDFIHTTNYFDLFTKKLILNNDAMTSVLNKELIYNSSDYPIISLIRMKKFERSGWRSNNIELFKICNDISKLNLKTKIDYLNAFCGCSNLTYVEIISILERYSFKDEINFDEFIKNVEVLILNK